MTEFLAVCVWAGGMVWAEEKGYPWYKCFIWPYYWVKENI